MPKDNDNEMMGPGVSDLVASAIDQKPLEFQQTFNDLLRNRISDAVQARKFELASGLASSEPEPESEPEETEADYEEVDDEESETEEEQ